MADQVQVIKEIISMSQNELKSIIKDPQSVGLSATIYRLLRWKERTKQKLSSHLKPPEIKNFDRAVGRINTSLSSSGYFSTIESEYNGYCLELFDDLESYPQILIPDMPDTKNYLDINVFISYAWANDNVVLAIDQWIRNKGIKTRIDKRDFFAGSRIRDEIVRVMSECQVILIFHSLQSKDKPWILFERELAADLEMSLKANGKEPPRIIYIVIDDTPLPSITEKNRIAIMAKGRSFNVICDEIYQNILQLPRTTPEIDLSKWNDFTF